MDNVINALDPILKEEFNYVPLCKLVAIASQIQSKGFLLPDCPLGSTVYRIERYNDENKIYEYTVNRMEQYLSGNEKQVVYSAHCEELEGFATENIMFFESAIGETVWLSYEEAQKELTI